MNATDQPPNATRRFQLPRLSMILATAVATIATYSAYLAMVKFGVNVLAMDTPTSMVTSGVFELLLFTVAVLAREAAKDGRPHGVLLFLTWLLSSASGFFAAWDEIYLGHPWAAAAFRFCIPLGAALGWHLALIGYRHLVTGVSWGTSRRTLRMQRFYEAVEAALRAADTGKAGRIARAQRRLIRARSAARRVVNPADMREHTEAWSDSDAAIVAMAEGARNGHNRLVTALLGANATDTHRPANATGNGTPTAIATVSNLRELARPTEPNHAATLNRTAEVPNATQNEPASRASNATPAPATQPAVTGVNATESTSGTGRRCKGCGKELPVNATSRAQYCVRFKEDGSRDQKCKNDHNARKRRAATDALERSITPRVAFA
jgi:hypothetical protein